MGRKPRIHYPGAFYHCLNRGNQRQSIFLSDEDYRFFLDTLASVRQKFGVRWHGYCLMPNHFHLLVEVAETPLSTIMRSVETAFALRFNFLYRKQGHVFQGRYRSVLCEKRSYLLELIRYIHLNPVRAHLVDQARQPNWPFFFTVAPKRSLI
jgi:REP element-mobilizing transposase RayT